MDSKRINDLSLSVCDAGSFFAAGHFFLVQIPAGICHSYCQDSFFSYQSRCPRCLFSDFCHFSGVELWGASLTWKKKANSLSLCFQAGIFISASLCYPSCVISDQKPCTMILPCECSSVHGLTFPVPPDSTHFAWSTQVFRHACRESKNTTNVMFFTGTIWGLLLL